MPSTYSPSLRIELIGDGEQSGTWGQTTNNNLGALLEQAITGITNVNVTSGDVTLTSFNGAVDEARSPVINVSGTPGVARNIVVPNQKKTYLVKNRSDAAIGVKTSTGAAQTVGVGSQSLMVCDGSNVVASYIESSVATPSFPSGTIMLFVQTSAPTGWTKVTTFNDAALRIVNGSAGSGGSANFSSVFGSGGVDSSSVALTTAQMPSHNHYVNSLNTSPGMFDPNGIGFLFAGGNAQYTANTGGSGAHSHNTTMQLKYVDSIIASKD
jgi:hypothetical protein